MESEGGIDFDPDFASIGARFVALVVDTVVLLVLMLPGIVVAALGSTVLVLLGILLAGAGFVVATALYARAVAATGQWFGSRLMSTRVVDARNGRNVTTSVAATRYAIRTWISPILLIGFLMALTNSSRQAFHDSFAGTVVIRPKRQSWSIDDEDPSGPPT